MANSTQPGERDALPGFVIATRLWWKPLAGGPIAKRGILDDGHKASAVIEAFDRP